MLSIQLSADSYSSHPPVYRPAWLISDLPIAPGDTLVRGRDYECSLTRCYGLTSEVRAAFRILVRAQNFVIATWLAGNVIPIPRYKQEYMAKKGWTPAEADGTIGNSAAYNVRVLKYLRDGYFPWRYFDPIYGNAFSPRPVRMMLARDAPYLTLYVLDVLDYYSPGGRLPKTAL